MTAEPMEDMTLLEVLAVVRSVARRAGYAVAVHGSLSRDIDLIAVPWGEVVESPSALVAAIVSEGRWLLADPQPEVKPHGRLAWAIRMPGFYRPYLDLSVIAPRSPAEAPS